MWKGLCVYRGDCPRTQIPIGGNLQIESERPDDMGKTSESLAELGGNQSGYAQEISNRKFETPSNGVIGRPEGGEGLRTPSNPSLLSFLRRNPSL